MRRGKDDEQDGGGGGGGGGGGKREREEVEREGRDGVDEATERKRGKDEGQQTGYSAAVAPLALHRQGYDDMKRRTTDSLSPPKAVVSSSAALQDRSKEAYSGLSEPGSLPYERHVPNYKPEAVLRASNTPRVKEVTERYRISLNSRVETQAWLSAGEWQPERRPLLDADRMVNGGFCQPELVKTLWREKERIDSFFDSKEDQQFYYRARNSIFPQDQKGSKTFRNRAGDKLYEVHDETDLFESAGKLGVFFDVCGGPGAWSEVLLKDTKKRWTGFGMTLKLPNTPMSDMWYKELETDGRWRPLWGEDGTGNVYNHKNLEHAAAEVTKLGTPVSLVMGDGGFHISTNAEGQHMEHLQELFSVRIILSELLACLKCVARSGNFCCKLFDTFSALTVSMIYLTGLCFESVYIIKPYRSRIVNSERYIVGKRLRERTPLLQSLIDHITSIHASWSDDENDGSHLVSLVPAEVMLQDVRFRESIVKQNEDLCQKQTLALKQVMDLAGELRSRGK